MSIENKKVSLGADFCCEILYVLMNSSKKEGDEADKLAFRLEKEMIKQGVNPFITSEEKIQELREAGMPEEQMRSEYGLGPWLDKEKQKRG